MASCIRWVTFLSLRSLPIVLPSAPFGASSQGKGLDRFCCPFLFPLGPEVPPWYARPVATHYSGPSSYCISLRFLRAYSEVGAQNLPRWGNRLPTIRSTSWLTHWVQNDQHWENIGTKASPTRKHSTLRKTCYKNSLRKTRVNDDHPNWATVGGTILPHVLTTSQRAEQEQDQRTRIRSGRCSVPILFSWIRPKKKKKKKK